MDPRRSQIICRRVLLTGLTLCVLFGSEWVCGLEVYADGEVMIENGTSGILCSEWVCGLEVYADGEVMIENGTSGILRCSFKSKEVVKASTSVTWKFQSSQPDSPFSKGPYTIFYYSNGDSFPGPDEFKDRVQFVGDINKRDVSIQLNPAQFSDNGTYFCDVNNPPDITGSAARTELRVVNKESLPQPNTALIVGGVCGSLFLLVLIAVAACITMRVMHSRHEYEGCTSLESVSSSQPPKPRKKMDSVARTQTNNTAAPLQGPVIYAQLDHSGAKSSFHKNEPVVYADIRKN